jgi:hypothetical protein
MSLNNGDGFDLGFKIDEASLNKILHEKSDLKSADIAALSLSVSMSNPKLKALVSLFANHHQITKIITTNGENEINASNPLEFDQFTVTQSKTQATGSFGTKPTIWGMTGVDLMYKGSKVISMEGANYTSGRPVAPSTPSPSLASSGSASGSSAASASITPVPVTPVLVTPAPGTPVLLPKVKTTALTYPNRDAAILAATAEEQRAQALPNNTQDERTTKREALEKARQSLEAARQLYTGGRSRRRPYRLRRRRNKSSKKHSS